MKKVLPVLLFSLLLCFFASAQNVGIGTSNPAYKLDVAGTVHATGTLTVDNNLNAAGNINATGDVTAHGGGVLYNTVAPAATNMKVYYRTAAFTVTNLQPHSLSIEGQVNIGGGFTAAPMVFVGDIVSTSGTAGALYQVQMVTYGSTTGSFKIRLLNNSDNVISQSITWNVMCIGK